MVSRLCGALETRPGCAATGKALNRSPLYRIAAGRAALKSAERRLQSAATASFCKLDPTQLDAPSTLPRRVGSAATSALVLGVTALQLQCRCDWHRRAPVLGGLAPLLAG